MPIVKAIVIIGTAVFGLIAVFPSMTGKRKTSIMRLEGREGNALTPQGTVANRHY
jgi:hypothetical protein